MDCPYDKYRQRGSASVLTERQQLLFIFVDDDGANGSWAPERRQSIEPHVDRAVRWLERKAHTFGVPLRFEHRFGPQNTTAQKVDIHICESDFAAGPHHATWQNQVAASIVERDGSVASVWEDLFSRHGLDVYKSDGQALLFGVRRYCPSVAFPFCDTQHPEFQKERGIIYDLGATFHGGEGQLYLDSQIAHELLHLYGAIDVDSVKFPADCDAVKDLVLKNCGPHEIMRKPTQHEIDKYEVSDLTAYLVGWLAAPPTWLQI